LRLRLYCIGSDRERHIGSLWGIFEERRAGHKFLRSKGHERQFGTRVLLEFSVPVTSSPIRVGGVAHSHSGYRYGFEFVDLSPDQREVISKTCRNFALLQQHNDENARNGTPHVSGVFCSWPALPARSPTSSWKLQGRRPRRQPIFEPVLFLGE